MAAACCPGGCREIDGSAGARGGASGRHKHTGRAVNEGLAGCGLEDSTYTQCVGVNWVSGVLGATLAFPRVRLQPKGALVPRTYPTIILTPFPSAQPRNKSMSSAASKSTRAACRSDAPPGPTTPDLRILSHPPPQRLPKGAVVANARKASCAAPRSTAAQQPPPFGPQESTTEGSALEAKKSRQFRGRRMVTNIKLGGPALWSQGI